MEKTLQDPVSLSPTQNKKRVRFWQFVIILAMLGLITVLNTLLKDIIQPSSLVFIYLLPTIAGAIYIGIWAAVFSFICGFLIFDFLFVQPQYSLYISMPQDIYNVIAYFAIALLITYLINLTLRQNAQLKDRLDRVSFIEDMSRDFLLLTPLDRPYKFTETLQTEVLSQLGQLTLRYAKQILDVSSFVFFRDASEGLKLYAVSDSNMEIKPDDRVAANWTLDNGEVCGAGTHTHSTAPYFFIPITSHVEVIGVLGILYNSKELFPEQRRLLGAVSNLTTIVATSWMRLKVERT